MQTLSLKTWVRQRIDGRTRVNAPDLVDEYIGQLSLEDLRSIAIEYTRMVVGDVIRNELNRTRRTYAPKNKTEPDGITIDLRQPVRKWSEFLEFTGTHRVRVMAMTHEELKAAAAIREKRGERDLTMACFERLLATRVPPGKTVGDVLTESEVQAYFDEAAQVVASEMAAGVL